VAFSVGLSGSLWGAEAAVESRQRIEQDVTYLASDALEGRGVGTKGIDKAADYLAAEFAKIGLKTDLFDGGPFQKFKVTISTEMGPEDQNALTLLGPAREGRPPLKWELKLKEDFTPLAVGGSGSIDASLAFAGYGITAKDLEYDDYADLDVEGKVVIILRKEPRQKDAKSPFNGDKASQHALFMRKISNAFEHGAAAIIFVNDELELETRRAQDVKLWKRSPRSPSRSTRWLSRSLNSRSGWSRAKIPCCRSRVRGMKEATARRRSTFAAGSRSTPCCEPQSTKTWRPWSGKSIAI
jgi:hypothetical protein